MTNYKSELNEIQKKSYHGSEELFEFYDKLPPVTIEEMIGKWKGSSINCVGHWVTKSLDDMNWFGKWYPSQFDAHPLVCFNEDKKLFADTKFNGEASLWMVEFRGKVSGTMVYDGIPVFDHFRKVDDNTLFGVMNGKTTPSLPAIVQGGNYYYFFILNRVDDFPVEYIGEVNTSEAH